MIWACEIISCCNCFAVVRGENARNGYQCLVKRLRAIVIIQKHTREHRKRIEQLTGIICLQAGKIIDFQMWLLATVTKSYVWILQVFEVAWREGNSLSK